MMRGWDVPLCQHMHKLFQVLWFNVTEWAVLAGLYIAGLMASAWLWLGVPFVILVFFPRMREKRRSHYRHLRLQFGLAELKGYPPPIAGRYYE